MALLQHKKNTHVEIVAFLILICTNSRAMMLESWSSSYFNGNMFNGSGNSHSWIAYFVITQSAQHYVYVLREYVIRSCYVGGPSNKKSTMLNKNVIRERRARDPLPWCMAAGCSPATKENRFEKSYERCVAIYFG